MSWMSRLLWGGTSEGVRGIFWQRLG